MLTALGLCTGIANGIIGGLYFAKLSGLVPIAQDTRRVRLPPHTHDLNSKFCNFLNGGAPHDG